jgi:hypothetical protein
MGLMELLSKPHFEFGVTFKAHSERKLQLRPRPIKSCLYSKFSRSSGLEDCTVDKGTTVRHSVTKSFFKHFLGMLVALAFKTFSDLQPSSAQSHQQQPLQQMMQPRCLSPHQTLYCTAQLCLANFHPSLG